MDVPSIVKHPADRDQSIKYLVDPEQKQSKAITDVQLFKNSLKQLSGAMEGS